MNVHKSTEPAESPDAAGLKQELLQRLLPYGQEHLVAFWDGSSPDSQQALAAQIRAIDFASLARLWQGAETREDVRELAARAQSPPGVRLGDPANRHSAHEARSRGERLLRAGKVATLLVAGGQGTRLGFDHPKGLYPIGPISGRSLFQIHVEKIRALARRCGVRVPLYLMTSPATHDETIEFFRQHDHFGLPPDDLVIFCQGTMPAVDAESGRVLLERPDRVFVSPDGHGGMLAALAASGGLNDLLHRGIETLFYFQVDNPLVDIANAEFLGQHLLAGSEMTTQVVAKKQPLERVGNAVRVDGRMRVIEYSDLPDDVAARRNPDGRLAIWAGSIAVHAIQTGLLVRMAGKADSLPFHRARKKVPFLDPQGRLVQPAQPNALKFERFIFDLLPWAENAIVVEIDPREGFAPLKNASGEKTDTPEAVRAAMIAQDQRRLRAASVELPDDVPVEINPLFAPDDEELARKLPRGTQVTEPTYFAPAMHG